MGTCLSCQCSSKKSAATTFPADSPLGAWFRSRIAQSGSFGFWSEFVRSWASRKVGPELMTTYLVVERGLGYMRTGRWWSAEKDRLLLGNCFWREGLEAAFGPERRGEKGGCGGKRGGGSGVTWRWPRFRHEKSLIHAIFYWNREALARFSWQESVDSQSALPRFFWQRFFRD